MRTNASPRRSAGAPAVLALVSLTLAGLLNGCSCGGEGESDAGVMPRDTGPPVDSGRRDTGVRPLDGGDPDAGDAATPPADGGSGVECAGMRCAPFQYCDDGICRDFPACRGDGTCDAPGDVCHNRRCVPSEVDVDGDGFPAGSDCDETDPEVNPGATEICNLVDDDCNELVDDGDPAVLCEFYPGGGICLDGNCGCPEGTFDLDRSVPGCECVAAPALDQGLSCNSPIDLGDLADNGAVQTLTGNVMPDDREVWYQFRGVDSPDTACDNFHVRAQFTANPDDTFELTVFRGNCTTPACDDMGYADFSWATDFRATVATRLTGQCPCSGARVLNVSACENDTSNFLVRVRRRAGSALSCSAYTIEVSNGLYDTP